MITTSSSCRPGPRPSPEDTATTQGPSERVADALRKAARRLGTPFFAYDSARIHQDADGFHQAFPDPNWTRLYSLKANALQGLVTCIANHGFGANTVSRGEIALARRAGMPYKQIALEGIGKSERDLRLAVDLATQGQALLWTSLESVDEATRLAMLARKLRPPARLDVLLRLNPGVAPDTHPHLAVGQGSSKFGLTLPELEHAVTAAGGWHGPLRFRGIHVHVGSQLASANSWASGVASGARAFHEVVRMTDDADTLDVGGGFPAGGPAPAEFARAANITLAKFPWAQPTRLAIEPGRAVIARAGWLTGRVLHVRDRQGVNVIIDAGMTELPRPALYGAQHDAFALTSLGHPICPGSGPFTATIDGPICESTDRLGTASLPRVQRGDLITISLAGAYASAMASTYNGRPRPPELLIESDGTTKILRRRESLQTLR